MRRTSSALAFCLLLAACGQASTPGTNSMPPAGDTLSFSPQAIAVKVGETADVSVMLDIKDNASQTFQIEIAYDPAVVEIVDGDPTAAGTQIKMNAYETSVDNAVDVEKGRIRLMGYSLTPGKEVAGASKLATITVKGKATGNTALSFDATIGDAASKTKVILKGDTKDLVTATSSATITVAQ